MKWTITYKSNGKFTKFKANKKLTRVILLNGKQQGTKEGKFKSKDSGYTGIIIVDAQGKRLSANPKNFKGVNKNLQLYSKGFVYKSGVHIFSLARNEILTKNTVADINSFLESPNKNQKGIKTFIMTELYKDRYPDDIAPNISEQDINFE